MVEGLLGHIHGVSTTAQMQAQCMTGRDSGIGLSEAGGIWELRRARGPSKGNEVITLTLLGAYAGLVSCTSFPHPRE